MILDVHNLNIGKLCNKCFDYVMDRIYKMLYTMDEFYLCKECANVARMKRMKKAGWKIDD